MINSKIGLAKYLSKHEHPRGIIICPERKFVYMKATKTAGTSVLRGVLEQKVSGIIHQKDNPQEFQSWIDGITDDTLNDYFIFTIIRNPWDRVVSIASYFNIPFSDFIVNFNHYCKDDKIRIHSLPLHIYTHHDGKLFSDLICRFENLQAGMNKVFDHIGLPRTELPYLNPSDHQHYSAYYSQKEIDLVAELYKIDIELFGYTFDEN
jgi:hypothetical protein